MNNEIICIASFVAKHGCILELGAALNKLIEPTRKEEGCISYDLYQQIENKYLFTMVEKFKNKEAFDFHSSQSYLEDFKNDAKIFVEAVTINIFKKFEG